MVVSKFNSIGVNNDFGTRLKQEFVSGWKPFEVVWLVLFIITGIWAYVQTPDSWLE